MFWRKLKGEIQLPLVNHCFDGFPRTLGNRPLEKNEGDI